MSKNILVTGATGNIGSLLVPKLAGYPDIDVRALVRDPDKARAQAAAGAAVVAGDFYDPASLDAAMVGIDTIVLVVPPGKDCVAQNEAITSAARRAGVSRVIRISAIKAAEDGRTANTRLHGHCDRLLQESGLDYVILRPNYYMQNMFLMADSIRSDSRFAAGMGDGRLAMIDVRDVADAVTATVMADEFDNSVYELSGPASISFHDIAATLGELTGRPIAYIAITPDEVAAMLLSYGFDEWHANLLREYSAAYGDGWGDLVTGNVEALTGHAARSFRQFAADLLLPALS